MENLAILGKALSILLYPAILIIGYFVKRNDTRVDKIEDGLVELKNIHESDMQGWQEKCAEKHEREYTRSTDYATKSDVAEIKIDIRAVRSDVQAINNNLLALAQRNANA